MHFVRVARTRATVGVDGRGTESHRWYIYAWRGGPRIAAVDGGPRPRLSREMAAAVKQAREDATRTGSETIGGLIRDWHRSPEWAALAATTRETWQYALNRIEAKWGETPLALWDDGRMVGKVVAWRDASAATPRTADIGVTVMARLLEWGRVRARVRVNVAAGVPTLYRGADRAEIIWTDDDIAKFVKSADTLKLPQAVDGMRLAALTGLRRADLVALTITEASGQHAIIRTALKKSRGRRRRAAIPKLPETDSLIAELLKRPRKPGVETLLVNSKGRPWKNGASFGACFNRVRDHAGIVHPGDPRVGEPDRAKHLHDFRGTFVTKLCRAFLSDSEIAEITAWSPASVSTIRKTYVDDAATVVAIGKRIGAAL